MWNESCFCTVYSGIPKNVPLRSEFRIDKNSLGEEKEGHFRERVISARLSKWDHIKPTWPRLGRSGDDDARQPRALEAGRGVCCLVCGGAWDTPGITE